MHFKWNYVPPTSEEIKAANELGERSSISPLLAQLLTRRGITIELAAKRLFRPQLADLINPFLMKDMDLAVDRLSDAMGRKERIMVYGDYDVDGYTAAALAYKFLQQFYSNVDYHISDRYDEDYGTSKKGIDHVQETGVKLTIILDCGIKVTDEIVYTKSLGIDFIICDHHVPDEVMPPVVVTLNPKCPDDSCPFKHLSGCGVGFKFMQAFAKNSNTPFSRLIPLLNFYVVGISADIVSAIDENRILVFHGLKQLSQNPGTGLKVIIDICNLNGRDISMNDIVSRIGLCINASGCMENGKKSADFLVEKDFASTLRQAEHTSEYDEQRKNIDKQMIEEVNSVVAKLEGQKHHLSIVLHNENRKKGIVGIVASRLTEIYFRPTVVLTHDGEFATGSAHSVMGFDVYSTIKGCRDLLVNFGGHTHVAGLTLRWDDIKKFRERFQEYVDLHIESERTESILNIDTVIDFKDITKRLHADLKKFSPFGPGNSKPLFGTFGVFNHGTSKVVGREQGHIKLELVDSKSGNIVNGTTFGQSASARYIKPRRGFDTVYTLEDNAFKRNAAQLQIEDIRSIGEEE